jgi:hypothetical protein
MEVYLLAIALVGLAIGGIAIKMFLIPGSTFTKTCGSSVDPKTGKSIPCSCASDGGESCHNQDEEKSSDLIVNIKPYKA